MVKILLTLIGWILLLPIGAAWAAEIEVRSDRELIYENESFQLIFTASQSPDGDPDFDPLEKDFEVIGRAQSSNISVVNGKVTKSVTWTLSMMARKTGRLTVPSIRFGSDQSPEITITVKAAGAGNHSTKQLAEVMLETEATPKDPYVQSQVIYTVRVLHAVNISEARLSEPQLSDAVVEKLGEDIQYNTRREGNSYSVIERKYAIFPQKSGTATIDPLTLTAQVVTGRRSGSMFDGFFRHGITRSQRVKSDAVRLNIKPIPKTFTGKHWLAAENVELSDELPDDASKIVAGEPITRTLSLKVEANTVGQLPDLSDYISPSISNDGGKIKIYPDQPALNEEKTQTAVISKRVEKTALIPSRQGRYTLPAIELPWWNTTEDKMEVALIPERIIEVLPSKNAESNDSNNQPIEVQTPPSQSAAQPIQSKAAPAKQTANWMWALLGLAGGWASALLVWWLRRSRRPANVSSKSSTQSNQKAVEKAVLHACRQNNPRQAKEALLEWARNRWNPVSVANLEDLAIRCESDLRAEISRLNQALYGKDAMTWKGESLSKAFQTMQAKTPPARDSSRVQLEPLYKT